MGAPKPALGHSSRTEAALALRELGHGTAAIAAKLGIPSKSVSGLLCNAERKRRGEGAPDTRTAPPPARPGGMARRGAAMALPCDVTMGLRDHARRRGLTVPQLALLLVEVALDDGLIDAILDDRDAAPKARRAA